MERTRVKICGITRVEDALAAAAAGADAIGMVLYPRAGRAITPERVHQIMLALPPFVTPVGLFVDEDTRVILDLAEDLHLRHVQLHGDESVNQVAELRALTVLKAIRVTREGLAGALAPWREAYVAGHLPNLAGFVLETGHTRQAGGTGVENDWAAIREARNAGLFDNLPPVIAAGGLHPGNVADVVRDLHPFAVDVSSGVEGMPGRKSVDKMNAFIHAVRTA